MSYRASRPRRIAAFFKDGLTAAESVPVFHNLRRSKLDHADGFAHPVTADFPDLFQYDRIRFLFSPIVLNDGSLTDLTVSVYCRLADGTVLLAGESNLTAAGTLLPIEFENYDAQWAVSVTDIDGSTPDIDLNVAVQGVHASAGNPQFS